MDKYLLLSIDESGKASYKHSSELFILSGIVIQEQLRTKLIKSMRYLKSKYFNNEEIVFHSRDVSRRKGLFSNLQ
ncbi:MAG: hypothetical protein M1371_05280, partial [Actinobacteria bacterium]|nr:hypothetical protein [Actinomycetota bacterium]